MPNPLFNMLGGGQLMPAGFGQGMLGNVQKIRQQYQQFRTTFQGDPRAEVEKMLQSGRLSQQQLNELQSWAQQFQQLMNG